MCYPRRDASAAQHSIATRENESLRINKTDCWVNSEFGIQATGDEMARASRGAILFAIDISGRRARAPAFAFRIGSAK